MDQLINALIGGCVIFLGIGLLWALILGLKSIGQWTRSTFKGKDIPSRAEVLELKEMIEAVREVHKAATKVDVK